MLSFTKAAEGSVETSDTTTFLQAMSEGKVQQARLVLAALEDSSLSGKTGPSGKTLLIFSVLLPRPSERLQFMKMLLGKGVPVNGCDSLGRTALSHACECGYVDAVKLLVQYGADPMLPDCQGNTPWMYGAITGHKLVLKFLLKELKRMRIDPDQEMTGVAQQQRHGNCGQTLRSYMLSKRLKWKRKTRDAELLHTNKRQQCLNWWQDSSDEELGAAHVIRNPYARDENADNPTHQENPGQKEHVLSIQPPSENFFLLINSAVIPNPACNNLEPSPMNKIWPDLFQNFMENQRLRECPMPHSLEPVQPNATQGQGSMEESQFRTKRFPSEDACCTSQEENSFIKGLPPSPCKMQSNLSLVNHIRKPSKSSVDPCLYSHMPEQYHYLLEKEPQIGPIRLHRTQQKVDQAPNMTIFKNSCYLEDGLCDLTEKLSNCELQQDETFATMYSSQSAQTATYPPKKSLLLWQAKTSVSSTLAYVKMQQRFTSLELNDND
ncbi:ANR63 protein, partial [Polypterus senegalus]